MHLAPFFAIIFSCIPTGAALAAKKQWTEMHNTVYQPRVKMDNSGHRLATPQSNPYPFYLPWCWTREQMRTDLGIHVWAAWSLLDFKLERSSHCPYDVDFEFPMIGWNPENQSRLRDGEN